MSKFDPKRFKVANPDALGEKEKELWVRIEPLVQELLSELKTAGKIESVFLSADMALLDVTLRKLDEFSMVHNMFIHLSDSELTFKEFLTTNSKFGFTETNTIATYIIAAITVAVLSTELFKLLLLFTTKDVDPRVANFSRTMAREAPQAWKNLEPFVDSPFRNALTHGTYAIVNKKIRLFENAKLETLETDGKVEEMELSDFMMRIKDQNVLYQVLVNVVAEKAEKRFFAPS